MRRQKNETIQTMWFNKRGKKMKHWEKEKGFSCPMCKMKTLLHVKEAGESASTHYCTKCDSGFLLTEEEERTEEQQEELLKLGCDPFYRE